MSCECKRNICVLVFPHGRILIWRLYHIGYEEEQIPKNLNKVNLSQY